MGTPIVKVGQPYQVHEIQTNARTNHRIELLLEIALYIKSIKPGFKLRNTKSSCCSSRD